MADQETAGAVVAETMALLKEWVAKSPDGLPLLWDRWTWRMKLAYLGEVLAKAEQPKVSRPETGPIQRLLWVGGQVSTTDGQPPSPGFEHGQHGAPQPIDPATGQHGAYFVLSAEERAKGFVRPVRQDYVHRTCGTRTIMGIALAETWARDPSFYGRTFCVGCREHLPVGEFVWDGTDLVLGS